jgi:hypothetical protein
MVAVSTTPLVSTSVDVGSIGLMPNAPSGCVKTLAYTLSHRPLHQGLAAQSVYGNDTHAQQKTPLFEYWKTSDVLHVGHEH